MIIKQSRDIIDIVSCYEKSRIILTACELDLFTQTHEGVNTAEILAASNKLNPEATQRLLDCLVSLNLLDKNKNQYHVTEYGFSLSSSNSEGILPFIKILNNSWNNWSKLTEFIRDPSPSKRRSFYEENKQWNKEFLELMHSLSHKLVSEIAEVYDISRFKNMLDIGGASGTYTIAFLKKNPDMTATILDLEFVLPAAQERLKLEGVYERVKLIAGDYNKDSLPKDYDLVLLSDIMGQNTNEENLILIKKVYRILNPNGVLLIRDYVMNELHTYPPDGTLFSMLMLVETQGVGTYSFSEYKELLQDAGFLDINLIIKGESKNSLIEAKKLS